jgi:hypothetical protein
MPSAGHWMKPAPWCLWPAALEEVSSQRQATSQEAAPVPWLPCLFWINGQQGSFIFPHVVSTRSLPAGLEGPSKQAINLTPLG